MNTAVVTWLPSGKVELRFTFNRTVVDQLKWTVPASARSWDPIEKVWTVDGAWAPSVIRVLEEAFGDDCVEIVDQREPVIFRSTIDPDLATLYLLPAAPPELIPVCYRTLAKVMHPDAGGDADAMRRLNSAFDRLKARGLVAAGGGR